MLPIDQEYVRWLYACALCVSPNKQKEASIKQTPPPIRNTLLLDDPMQETMVILLDTLMRCCTCTNSINTIIRNTAFVDATVLELEQLVLRCNVFTDACWR